MHLSTETHAIPEEGKVIIIYPNGNAVEVEEAYLPDFNSTSDEIKHMAYVVIKGE